MGEYRPISLCNVLHKIVAKVLASRLKLILPELISTNQSAFVSDRLIMDNIIIAYETIHSLNSQSRGQNRYMTLKLDMRKKYDCVEWSFLAAVMYKMGFHMTWVKMIMSCVRSVSYLILVNETHQPNFRPFRGIRQGDPLFPTFLFCAQKSFLVSLIELKLMGLSPASPLVGVLAHQSSNFCR